MNKSSGFLSVPVAIIIAGVLIAVAVIYSVGRQNVAPTLSDDPLPTAAVDQLRPVDASDHILGSLDAPAKIVEYSDPECPFCKRFHDTMKQISEEYNGKVAWVYRSFPLDSLHPKARKESEAMECAAKLGGNDLFWAYLNRLMEITPANNGLDLAELPKIASYVGLDVARFNACLSSGEMASRVDRDAKNAIAAGAEGTPYSVVIGRDGKKSAIPGALPYNSVREIVEQALQ